MDIISEETGLTDETLADIFEHIFKFTKVSISQWNAPQIRFMNNFIILPTEGRLSRKIAYEQRNYTKAYRQWLDNPTDDAADQCHRRKTNLLQLWSLKNRVQNSPKTGMWKKWRDLTPDLLEVGVKWGLQGSHLKTEMR